MSRLVPSPEERESSLYEEIFSDREAEAKRRMPIGKIVVSVLALMIVLTYWSGSRRRGSEFETPAQQTPQGTGGLPEVEIKNGLRGGFPPGSRPPLSP